MIALILALVFGWQTPCFVFPALHDPITGDYAQSIGFSAPVGGPRLWSTQPIIATIDYGNDQDSGVISLRQSLSLRELDGAFSTRSTTPYTLYLCAADQRPSVIYLPLGVRK